MFAIDIIVGSRKKKKKTFSLPVMSIVRKEFTRIRKKRKLFNGHKEFIPVQEFYKKNMSYTNNQSIKSLQRSKC